MSRPRSIAPRHPLSYPLRVAALALAASALALPAAAQGLERVRFNIGSSLFNISDAWESAVPAVMGFYAEEGLDVQMEAAQGGGPAIQQLMAGQVVLTITGNPTAFTMINKGAPMKIVASLWASNRFYPVVPADSPIKSLSDLKGKRVGTLALASANTLWAKVLLKEAGLDPNKDVTFVGVGTGGSIMSAFNSKEIEAMQSMEGTYDLLEARGFKLRRFDDLPSLEKLSFTSGMMVTDETIAKRPHVVRGLMRAHAKGLVYSLAHPEAALRMYWKYFPQQMPRGISEADAVKQFLPVMKAAVAKVTGADGGPYGHVEKDRIDAVIKYFHELGELPEALPAERYYDGRFIKEANDFDRAKVRALPPKL